MMITYSNPQFVLKTKGIFRSIFSTRKFSFTKYRTQFPKIISNTSLQKFYCTKNVTNMKKHPLSQETIDLIKIGDNLWSKFSNSDCPVEKHELSLRIAGAYSKALDIEDSFESASDIYMRIGICYIHAKKYFVACKALESSLEMDPNNFVKNKLFADTLFLSKSWNRAIEVYTTLLTDFSESFKEAKSKSSEKENLLAEVLYKRAFCYDNLNDNSTAQEAYISVLKTKKSKYTPLTYYRLAWMEGIKGNWKSCNNVLNIGLKIDPNNPLLLDLKTTAVYVLGKKDESRQYFYSLSKVIFNTIWERQDSNIAQSNDNLKSISTGKNSLLKKLIML